MNRLLVAQVGGAVPVVGALLLHEHWCIWSTLGRADAAALHSFASAAMMPAAQAAAHPSLTSRITASLRCCGAACEPCQSYCVQVAML